MPKKYYIKTFGCQQNNADSERIAAVYKAKNYTKAKSYTEADEVIINTCMVRESAENRVYGLVNNLAKIKAKKPLKIIVTGCMIGLAIRDKKGKFMHKIKKAMPEVDEFLAIEEVGFNLSPIRASKTQALVPISNGCNNFCTYCVVPFTRGREISRPFEEIIFECQQLKQAGYTEVMLLGQNVNSYGADLVTGQQNPENLKNLPQSYFAKPPNYQVKLNNKTLQIKPTLVKHLGRHRLPTLFPQLLNEVAKLGFSKVDFMSSNPWDFSTDLINIIAKHQNITRTLHLPVQSGSNTVLKRMNRWYTAEEYLNLIKEIKKSVRGVKFTTDIIVGFCSETEEEYNSTAKLCQAVNFEKAYISIYSKRPLTNTPMR
jgi:tRNA-2-methylthio-N6-dimethylallyladenosine synthase